MWAEPRPQSAATQALSCGRPANQRGGAPACRPIAGGEEVDPLCAGLLGYGVAGAACQVAAEPVSGGAGGVGGSGGRRRAPGSGGDAQGSGLGTGRRSRASAFPRDRTPPPLPQRARRAAGPGSRVRRPGSPPPPAAQRPGRPAVRPKASGLGLSDARSPG